ncbi:NUDIX hydrolase [Dactylosporangium sp. CA-139066]|uniref:NUDIX hydrolase n=1 Tax=Dactylosporangium sp. CA-139066 TaxID=3239930 RepID=UPI003D92E91D
MTGYDPCCRETVGVLIADEAGRLLMFARQQPPPGVAPVAGHVGEHGDFESAARAEVAEEVGLTVVRLEELARGWRSTWCRRGSDGHMWRIYRAEVSGTLQLKPDEAANAGWYGPAELQVLADLTVAHARGELLAAAFEVAPGLEPVWVSWLAELGHIIVPAADLAAVEALAQQAPEGAR